MVEAIHRYRSRIEEKLEDTAGVEEAIRRAQELAIRRHAAAGRKIPRWRNNQVEWVDAATLLPPDECK